MQLDRTRIAIRERGLLETLDLALHVVRAFAWPVITTFALGAIPLMVINHALLGWMMDVEYRDMWLYSEDAETLVRFLWDMILLVVIEAPAASIFTTAYLGKAMFVDRPRLGEVLSDGLQMLPRLAWCQLFTRGLLAAWLILLTLNRDGEFQAGSEFFFLGALTGYSLSARAFRPFLNEIILLERSPLRTSDPSALTVSRRSRQLHAPSRGDLLARSLGIVLFAVLLTGAGFGTLVFISGVFLNDWKPDRLMFTYGFPLSMWMVAGYFSVVRFLSYLDLRMRHEGWEVELRMRAEAARLTSPWS